MAIAHEFLFLKGAAAMSNAQGHLTNTGCTVWAGLSLCKEFPVDQQLLLAGFGISYQGKLSRYLARRRSF